MASGHINFREGKNGKKSWFYTIPGPKRADGKRRQIQRRGFATKAAAQKARTKALAEIESGTYAEAAKQTTEEYLYFWLGKVQHTFTPRTHGSYERAIRLHLAPRLGSVRLDQLTALHIDSAYADALAAGTSAHLVRYCHVILKAALRRAVGWELLTRNPADAVRPPKPARDVEEDEDRTVRALTEAEVARYLRELEGLGWLAAVIALGTGLRRGEVLGLRWQDIDWGAGKISVRQTVEPQAEKGQGIVIGPPKTEASRRTFTAPAYLLELLRRHRGAQAAKRLIAPVWDDQDLVLCRDNGRPIVPVSLQRWHWKARKAAGLPELRFHDLRHTFATNQLRGGVDVTTVSRRLGHTDPSITLRVYSHVLPDQQEHAAQVADAGLRKLLAG